MCAKAKKIELQAQNPLILRCHRLIEAFAKSDDERDFYLDNIEGFIIYVDLDKSEEEIAKLEKELEANSLRYFLIPKLTFYEIKKIMEGFVTEKVYDIDTKEKLLDIIQSKEARENFLEFIYDHHTELEKWQQYYQERSRIRIIEWLRQKNVHFIFEEDLNLSTSVIEKLKQNLFEKKPGKEIEAVRKTLEIKAKAYYSNEALNPRPKRGRPPKQTQKLEMEHPVTIDIYTEVPKDVQPFLFTPEITSVFDITFSSRFETREELLSHRSPTAPSSEFERNINHISEKLASLRKLSNQWGETKVLAPSVQPGTTPEEAISEDARELLTQFDKDKSPREKASKPKKSLTKEKPKRSPVKRIIAKDKSETNAVANSTKNKAPATTKKRQVRKLASKKTAAEPSEKPSVQRKKPAPSNPQDNPKTSKKSEQ
ncbi:MAG: UPF0158 family protein [Waddliaceae bacterium]